MSAIEIYLGNIPTAMHWARRWNTQQPPSQRGSPILFIMAYRVLQPSVNNIIHLPSCHLHIRPAHRTVDGGDARECVSLNNGSGIGGRVAGVLEVDARLDRRADRIHTDADEVHEHEDGECGDERHAVLVPPKAKEFVPEDFNHEPPPVSEVPSNPPVGKFFVEYGMGRTQVSISSMYGQPEISSGLLANVFRLP